MRTETQYDPEQLRLMEEPCIRVDADDSVLGAVSKKECLFSVFLLLRVM
jgi:hypothetical protein